ncbi:MAG: hypothetical protein H0X62_14950, partial [Bacteroidetes bacterium]|nr:hypothetical protein [Bacteroidota bacterium]
FMEEEMISLDYIEADKATILNEKLWTVFKDSIYYHKGIFDKNRPKLYYHSSLYFKAPYYKYNSYDNERNLLAEQEEIEFRNYNKKMNLERDTVIAKVNIEAYCSLLKKYYKDTIIDTQAIFYDFVNHNYRIDKYRDNYFERSYYETKMNINSIGAAKNRNISTWSPSVIIGIALFAFYFAVVFQVFKNVHWKQLLLAAAIGTLLFTLVIITDVVSRSNFKIIPLFTALIPLLLLLISFFGTYIKRFSWILNQANILLSFLLPFLPIIILNYLDSYHKIFTIAYFDQYKVEFLINDGFKEMRYSPDYYELVNMIWISVFIFGIGMYLFFWNSYLKHLFLRYWNLPKLK